jgi:alpha-amylase
MEPVRFVFGLHLHQPVGNFDHVFAQHVADVYRPLLHHLARREFFPLVLHVSGPLLEWLEIHDRSYLDHLGRLVADDRVELLLAGFYEPVLASLPRRDRVEQIQWMREALRRRFGVDARGLWLTERVWEPDLAADLAAAGVRYALVDDRHFLATGFPARELHAPFWTESDGKRVALFPIHERLRYLIPFRAPEETAEYLRQLRGEGHRLAVLADDGEKFGGWPGTKEWVYDRGWLDRFTGTIGEMVQRGEVRLCRLDRALAEIPGHGIAYLPTASYREMETWSLPPDAAVRLTRLEHDLGEDRMAGPDGALVRGAHWRNFLVRYPEANRMHKKMQHLSALCRRRGNPAKARRAIGRAQCNDAYWHGVFGGLYLPHLREAVWRNLAEAEGELRKGKALGYDIVDFDGDGHDEVWVHSRAFSAVLSPRRGAALEELTAFQRGVNYANTLTRRREAYHEDGSAASIDADDRAIFVDRILSRHVELEEYRRGDYRPVVSWSRAPFGIEIMRRKGAVEVVCRARADGAELIKRYRFEVTGAVRVTWRWDPSGTAPDDLFTTELSLAVPLGLDWEVEPEMWRFPIETVAKSERGFDRSRQGDSLTLRWPAAPGTAWIELRP